MSRRARQRQDSRPWKNPTPYDTVDWSAVEADRVKREQQQAQQPSKGQQQ